MTWRRVYGGPPVPADATTAKLFGDGVDRRPVRNRVVVRTAVRAAEQGSVAVLAGSVGHAARLASMLARWSVLTSPSAHLRDLPRGSVDVLTAAGRGVADRLIVTPDAARSLDLAEVDVVVRASGGTGLVVGLQDKRGVPAGTRRTVRLIDFADGHDGRLRRHADDRRRAYGDAGWLPPGTDPVAERVEAFLRSRPCSGRRRA